jgi:hypothetical protein
MSSSHMPWVGGCPRGWVVGGVPLWTRLTQRRIQTRECCGEQTFSLAALTTAHERAQSTELLLILMFAVAAKVVLTSAMGSRGLARLRLASSTTYTQAPRHARYLHLSTVDSRSQDARTCPSTRRARYAAGLPLIGSWRSLSQMPGAGSCARRNTKDPGRAGGALSSAWTSRGCSRVGPPLQFPCSSLRSRTPPAHPPCSSVTAPLHLPCNSLHLPCTSRAPRWVILLNKSAFRKGKARTLFFALTASLH